MARKTTRKQRAPDPAARLIDAALQVAALQGWADTSMADIAETAEVSLTEARQAFASKAALLAAFIGRIDDIVLAGTDPEIAAEPVRDRLFDVIMRRFEALAPYKEGLRAILRDLPRDPELLICVVTGPHRRSLQWMLEAARIDPWGPLQPLQLKGLGLIYAAALRAWLRDDSDEQSKAMATLDRALDRADRVARFLNPMSRGARGRDDATAESE